MGSRVRRHQRKLVSSLLHQVIDVWRLPSALPGTRLEEMNSRGCIRSEATCLLSVWMDTLLHLHTEWLLSCTPRSVAPSWPVVPCRPDLCFGWVPRDASFDIGNYPCLSIIPRSESAFYLPACALQSKLLNDHGRQAAEDVAPGEITAHPVSSLVSLSCRCVSVVAVCSR